MLTLVGSRAIKHWFPDFREPKDWDYLAADERARRVMLKPEGDLFIDERLTEWAWGPIATPDELYTLKCSHAFWVVNSDQNWNKHMADLLYLQKQGAQFIRPLYDILKPIWKELHGGRKAKLVGASKDGFFKDAVVRKYDHDSLHRSVAWTPGKPMYERILRDGSEVDCSWDKFMALSEEDRLVLCQEEVMATALERILIPRDYKGSPRAAYAWALRRTITSLFVNEWALYIVLNFDRMNVPLYPYMRHHKDNSNFLILNGE